MGAGEIQIPSRPARTMILDSYIDNYIGEWNDESGNRLSIKKVDETTALVSFSQPLTGSRFIVAGAGKSPLWT
jgi:hypothetical protein